MDQPYQLPPFFHEIFDPSLPRLGPGDNASTMRALDTLLSARKETRDSPALRILDIGCGNGTPTIQLAKHTTGTIVNWLILVVAGFVRQGFVRKRASRAGRQDGKSVGPERTMA